MYVKVCFGNDKSVHPTEAEVYFGNDKVKVCFGNNKSVHPTEAEVHVGVSGADRKSVV